MTTRKGRNERARYFTYACVAHQECEMGVCVCVCVSLYALATTNRFLHCFHANAPVFGRHRSSPSEFQLPRENVWTALSTFLIFVTDVEILPYKVVKKIPELESKPCIPPTLTRPPLC